MAVENPNGERKDLVAIDIYYEDGILSAGFSRKDQNKLGVPATAVLNVDTNAYQRALSQKHVEDIRADWDHASTDEPSLSLRRDNSIWIINGQHVLAAAVMEGEGEMLVWLYRGLTIPGEARIRRRKNFSRGDTALEKFHSRITEEEEAPGTATAIVALLDEFATYINRAPNKHRGVNCVATVEKLYKRDGGAILRRAFRTLHETYGELHGEVVTASLLEGVAWFMTVHYGELQFRQLVGAMRDQGPEGLNDMARGFKRAMGGADWINLYRAIVEAYNKKTRKVENKLEFKTSRYTAQVPAQAIREEEARRGRRAA